MLIFNQDFTQQLIVDGVALNNNANILLSACCLRTIAFCRTVSYHGRVMADLNPHQQTAVEHVEGPLLVLAGAGSGKTRVVTHRIAHLIDWGVPPSQILAVTFTNKAADEMRTRVRLLKNAQVLTCTFHSLGARILRESIELLGYHPGFAIYDEEDSEKVLKACFEQLNLGEEKKALRQTRAAISACKNNLEAPGATEDRLLRAVFPLYQEKLKECNALDFDDLLYLPVELLRSSAEARLMYQTRWMFLLIDEYQDTNFAQYTLARMLSEKHGNLFAVGDPDQSIYSWRGARYQNILNFEKDFPGARVITLDQNYRSTNTILKASNALIQHNPNRYEKNLWSAGGVGEKIGVFIAETERQEAEFVAQQIGRLCSDQGISTDEIAIFYRTNAQSRPLEDAFLARRIPYTILGGLSFYARKEVKDILAYLKMVLFNSDLISFLRTVNLPRRGLGPTAIDKLVGAAERHKIAIFSVCQEMNRFPECALSPKQSQGLREYVSIVQALRDARPSLKIHELIAETVSRTKYLEYLLEDPESAQERKENIDELLGKAAEWEEEADNPSLAAFLEELSLRSSSDEAPKQEAVKLMSLHNSKGLEFNTVFLVGLEEDLLPHLNSKHSPEGIEEERRLCYVGMTRAMNRLYLSAASHRFVWGSLRRMERSRFFKEIPAEFLSNLSPTAQRPHFATESSPRGFLPGEKVLHEQFGQGIVRRTFEGSLGLTYEILFNDSNATRTLVAKYAKLRPFTDPKKQSLN